MDEQPLSLWLVLLVALAAALPPSVAYVVWRYRHELWGAAEYAGRKLREGCFGLLWRLVVRPARDHLGLLVSVDADKEATGTEDAGKDEG